jgi:hypothetical protein
MKKYILTLIVTLSAVLTINAQEVPKSHKTGWFITPEISAMFLDNHVGNSVGASFGIKVWKERLKIGINAYGRSGPINPKTFTVEAYNGQTYKGSSTLRLRADYGTLGLMVAPTFKIKKIQIDVPISYGMAGGGFYLVGEDRKTPDGARVSEWENKLMNGQDAAQGSWLEFGVRGFFPTKINGIQIGAGFHYSIVQGWKTYYDPTGGFYNNKFRTSLFVNFGSY